jgi:hypothetical protein
VNGRIESSARIAKDVGLSSVWDMRLTILRIGL